VSPSFVGREEAGRLAVLHASAFDRPWSEAEMLDLMDGGAAALATDVGFLLIRLTGEEAEVLTLAVRPEARGRGLGRALIEAALAHARAAGASGMFLEVAADNAPALALYERAGFARLGTRRGYYPRPGGPAVDALTLRCALNSPAP
jgi:ribosomal-protein-alanine N-acetyltransferase